MKRMKCRLVFVFVIQLLACASLYSCNVCGGVLSAGSLNLLSQYKGNFVGLSYSHATQHSTGLVNGYQDEFHQVLLSARYRLLKNWRVQVQLPFANNVRHVGDVTSSKTGLGDLSILIAHQWLPKGDLDKKWNFLIELAGGLQCPTGKYEGSLFDEGLPRGFNAGRSQLGMIASPSFSVFDDRQGFILAPYYLHAFGPHGKYAFGDQWRLALNYYRTVYEKSSFSIEPSIGLQWEGSGKDVFATGKKVDDSGGQIAWQQLSVSIKRNNVICQGTYGVPIVDQLNASNIDVQARAQVRIVLIF